MTEFYLITGFLGAGKTTFLKRMVRLFPEKRIAVIVNEYGAEDVDGALVREAQIEAAVIEGGSIFCACRFDRFEAVLDGMLATGPDIVIAEASGLSDPSLIARILADARHAGRVAYRGCICLVDARNFHRVRETAVSVEKQLSVCGVALINKVDAVAPAQIEAVRAGIRAFQPGCTIHETRYGEIDPAWAADIVNPGGADTDAAENTRDLSVRSALLLLPEGVQAAAFLSFLHSASGFCPRIKGFAELTEEDGAQNGYLVDCADSVSMGVHACPEGARKNRIVCLVQTGKLPRLRQALLSCGLDRIQIQT